MQRNTDLHLHSRFSMATSPDMLPENILAGCRVKGISVVGSGDALHPEWRRMWEPYLENAFGITVVPQTEVEDSSRVHHVILAETFDQFAELQEVFAPACGHLTTAGRPHLQLNGEEIASAVHAVGGMIGPAHAFTPWTSLFAAYASPSECYGEEGFEFCELGLSADSTYGAGIAEFAGVPFLTNSDAHSPTPVKLGREFTRMEVSGDSPRAVLAAVSAGAVVLNAGFFPEEGKYNRTACTRCYAQFSLAEAEALHWRCPHDKGRIKLGVRERAERLSTLSVPTFRPPYLKMIPLGEVIARVLGASSPHTKRCAALYGRFIEAFDNEIAVLLEVPEGDLGSVSPEVAAAVVKMREGRVTLFPGGGGRYGSFSF
ncbi:MAG: endonuclease Q family protein [Methanocorpusculum sp.]|nr:endonuclease Q family protein [Methanocorpusculum sp.]MDE2521317.1 endonuclease Q family protein [Methanocorpusculum sp.]MDE2534584.1 endonuclease Q family protein [Methanocorpusculum sp.]MDE2548767.1 endonuclease Q family protein [Methanocorpusculum sp.]